MSLILVLHPYFLSNSLYLGKKSKIEVFAKSEEKSASGDDSDDDMFANPGLMDEVKQQSKKKPVGKIKIVASRPIKTKNGLVKVLVVIDGNLYYLKDELVKPLAKMKTDKSRTPFNPKIQYIFEEDILGIAKRDGPSSTTSKFYRTKKDNTVEVLTFTVTLPASERPEIKSTLDSIMNDYFKYIFGKERKKNTAGELALNHAMATPGFYKHLLERYGNSTDHDLAARNMTQETNKWWQRDIDYDYNSNLDRYMVDYDIKKWVAHHMGATSWDDVDEESKRICFKSYPARDLPEWNGLLQESYTL